MVVRNKVRKSVEKIEGVNKEVADVCEIYFRKG